MRLRRAVDNDNEKMSDPQPMLFRDKMLGRRAHAHRDTPHSVFLQSIEIGKRELECGVAVLNCDEEESQLDDWANRMERELESRHDSEVAPAARQSPEEIGVLFRRR